jgi:flavin-dependent dehydrogenase
MRQPQEIKMSYSATMRENLVIGGGLAGAMAALRLAAAGRDVLLIEKERGAHHKVCGEFLSPEAVEYLRQAGVDPERLDAAVVDRLRVSTKRRVVESRLPFRGLSLSRCVLDAALLARAADAGCDVRRGVHAQGLARHGQGWMALLADGDTQPARNVFLATGKHDLHRWNRPQGRHGDLVGFKMYCRLRTAQIAELRGFMDLFLFEGGYGGLALVEEGTANLCLVVRRSRLRRGGDWHALLASLCEENGLISERLWGAQALWERPLAISSIPYGYLCMRNDGVWPVGDQAAVVPSFTGDGMSIALHSGALAAETYLNGESPETYLRRLRSELHQGMSLGTLLSRAMVSRAGQKIAPFALTLLPRAIDWIATATRIPERALPGSAQAKA